ncbi:FERM domain-containing protein 4B isoform X2 [Periophthalmus magnuspinnatus]|uniref:FERM domain-containing protein 4B isoform X2 n=1 Tax=Periophthalmus magnuspinnatus TaxID=409849 RepID=UPI0024370726|nr:FERM domain-containing protein 4B isoform X2 [Periophthalmus magnuspinnatus]XP_055077616.1 FERM domain-containing protein 4B isoform X2 [Periophthalmus magnuspinnatus]
MAVRLLRGVEDLVVSSSQIIWTLAHQTLRRWYCHGLIPCQRLLETWFRVRKCYQMTEGRQCQIDLLDDRKLDLLVQPKLLSRELLDLVASHFNLKEKEYFGLCFIDDTGQRNWLQLDRKVLDHAFSKTSGNVELQFLVRFYIERITYLKENNTVELFFLNAKSLVYNETIEVESENVFKLAAFALQEAKGDYESCESARSDLKQLPVLPTRVLREHPSLTYCEDRVIEHYKKVKGLTRGQAIVKYLALVESLPTYGVHYYPVKDKQGIPWWLGVSYKGIGQYDQQDKLKPRKLYQWKQLENLYFREKKFAVEVNDPHRRTVTKRTFGQAGLVIHSWYASHSLIKTIWAMAISQHQFYLDRRQSKAMMTTARSTGDIAVDLTEIHAPRITKLSKMESKDQLIMASNGSLISAGSAESEVNEEQKKEKLSELKKKEKNLQEALALKLEELKKMCLREAELTGKLPNDYPLATGEKAPQVRRRVGTAFKLDDLFPYDEDPHLRNLESRFALQQKIVEAAMKLANEADLCKTVKKKRKGNFLDAMRKLEEIEKEINTYRVKKGKVPTQRASLILADDVNISDLSSLSDSLTLDDDEDLSSQRQRSRSVQYSPRPHHADTLDIHYSKDRRCSANEQQADSRLNYGQDPYYYTNCDALSSPYKQPSRQPRDARSMPPTPLLTRNAYSSTQLRSEGPSPHFRQRSGSLESQSQFPEPDPPMPAFVINSARRSNSTEVLDDGSSYTSQSSVEYSIPGNHNHHNPRRRIRGRHKRDLYANSGSMPNLAQPDMRCHAYQPRARPSTTAYYVTGYPSYPDPEPYCNGTYMYDNEMEGHYSVNAYHPNSTAYHNSDVHSYYGNDEVDGMHNLYATLRPPRNRPAPRPNEDRMKNMKKAVVAGHLRDWYQRNTAQKQPMYSYDYDRGSQHSIGYQTMPAPYCHSNRTIAYSTVSSTENWHSHMSESMLEYDLPVHAPQSYSYNSVPYSHAAHSRCPTELECPSCARMARPAGPCAADQENYTFPQ